MVQIYGKYFCLYYRTQYLKFCKKYELVNLIVLLNLNIMITCLIYIKLLFIIVNIDP